jgi:hypothetical protein
MEYFFSVCLGLGLSAAAGFRVFVPLLVTNIAYIAGFAQPQSGFEWMGTWVTFAVLASATLVEVAAYYIPWLDNLLDTIATPVAAVAGTLLMTSLLDNDHPVLRWGLGLILGGGSAGLIQAGTGLLRLGSTATTGGIANPVVATLENVVSVVLSVLSLIVPVLVAVGVVWLMIKVFQKLKNRPATSS